MKKLALLLILVPMFAMAEEVVTAPASGFQWRMFIQQIAANGGLVLLSFLASKIPGIGPMLKKVIDVFMGNPEHK